MYLGKLYLTKRTSIPSFIYIYIIWIRYFTWAQVNSIFFHFKVATFVKFEIQVATGFEFILANYFDQTDCNFEDVKTGKSNLLIFIKYWNGGYGVMVFVNDATNKILSHDWKYNVIVIMWPNFGDSNIFRKKLSKLYFYKDLTSKFNILEEGTLCPMLDWIDCIFYINLKRLYVYVNLFLKLFGFFIFELKVFLKVILKPPANLLLLLGRNY